MAQWQVNFQVVPHRAMAGAPRALTAETVAGTDWWGVGAVPPDLRDRLAAIAGPTAGSGAGVERWGKRDGNCVEVYTVGGRISRITVHVDVRKLDSKFGAALLGFVRSAQSVLVRTDGWVAEPTVGAFSGALRGDPAWQFATGPAAAPPGRTIDAEDPDE